MQCTTSGYREPACPNGKHNSKVDHGGTAPSNAMLWRWLPGRRWCAALAPAKQSKTVVGRVGCIGKQWGGGSHRPYLSHKGAVRPFRELGLPTSNYDPTSPTQLGCLAAAMRSVGKRASTAMSRVRSVLSILGRSSSASCGSEV